MEKRYQVFVSSTYEDLQEERREVMQALLELDCIPAGMELFPASNDDQWSLIKKVIDDCDYYIVIIGGRYGSTNADGISYTEMEYRYAVETNKPIIAFLHKKPEEIKSKFSEQAPNGKTKLEDFRQLAQQKMVKYWTTASELGGVVSRSMIKLINNSPAVGWVKATNLLNETTLLEILDLKKENEALKLSFNQLATIAPAGNDKLAQGDDSVTIEVRLKGFNKKDIRLNKDVGITTTWNELFASVSPYLTIECDEESMIEHLLEHLLKVGREAILKVKAELFSDIDDFSLPTMNFQKIKIQFKALGLITQSKKNKSIRDSGCYWTLTDYGDFIMTQLIAVKKI